MDVEKVLIWVKGYVLVEMNEKLNSPFSMEDIHAALKFMSPLKASSEDGLRVVFYQWFWHILGGDVTRFCIGS